MTALLSSFLPTVFLTSGREQVVIMVGVGIFTLGGKFYFFYYYFYVFLQILA